ncbi:hypothetical protein NHX12_001474 [Muraenolepis orangiensis]|uniref:Uncharacterized protein n=1 Tax=Muraenolepis orangiensis TaxID=630683 RepID=A0A9Q0E0S7_9TELE|nr:hypothetical protein NHX12_001474 [Muraenolepis orangiensis]
MAPKTGADGNPLFQRYMIASGAVDKEETVKIAILLDAVGEEALAVYKTLTITVAGDDMTMEDVLKALDDYCSPLKKNVVFERHQFWSHTMSPGMAVDMCRSAELVKTQIQLNMSPAQMLMGRVLRSTLPVFQCRAETVNPRAYMSMTRYKTSSPARNHTTTSMPSHCRR